MRVSRFMPHASQITGYGLRFAFYFMLALLNLWPLTVCPNCTAFPPDSAYTDLLISHWPNTEYWRQAVWQHGQWPLWNEQLFGGQPFAADPLAGLWYPPNWLLLILPLPFGFNLLWALHLAWAGLGLYQFLRTEGLPDGMALFGGAVFAVTPKLIAHIGAGHLSLVFAVAWTPWLLFSIVSPRFSFLSGLILGLTFLADPRWAFYSGLLAVVFIFSRSAGFKTEIESVDNAPLRLRDVLSTLSLSKGEGRRSAQGATFNSFRDYFRPTIQKIFWLALTALLISAALWLPLAEFVLQTNRSALTLKDAAEFSLPWLWLLGLLIAPLRGFHEYMTYVGLLPLILAGVGVARRQWFWLGVVLVSALFALGENFVLFPAVFNFLPGLSFLRVPSRAWFLVVLGFSVLAAYGLHHALSLLEKSKLKTPNNLPLSTLLLFAAFLLTTIDLARLNLTLIDAKPRPPLNAASAWLAAQPGFFRVYSPSYSLPLDDGLFHADGVNPLQLKSIVQFMERASGVPTARYSVTIPAYEGDLETTNANAVPSAELLGLLSVKYVAAEFDVSAPDLKLVQTFGRTRIYENLQWKPRAWRMEGGAAQIVQATPNRLVVQASGPGKLILSDVSFVGWQATVDGERVPIETAEKLLRSVSLVAGEHTIVFEFWPVSVFAGVALSLMGVSGVIWQWRKP